MQTFFSLLQRQKSDFVFYLRFGLKIRKPIDHRQLILIKCTFTIANLRAIDDRVFGLGHWKENLGGLVAPRSVRVVALPSVGQIKSLIADWHQECLTFDP